MSEPPPPPEAPDPGGYPPLPPYTVFGDLLGRLIYVPGCVLAGAIGEVIAGTWLAIVLVLVAFVAQRPLIRWADNRERFPPPLRHRRKH